MSAVTALPRQAVRGGGSHTSPATTLSEPGERRPSSTIVQVKALTRSCPSDRMMSTDRSDSEPDDDVLDGSTKALVGEAECFVDVMSEQPRIWGSSRMSGV